MPAKFNLNLNDLATLRDHLAKIPETGDRIIDNHILNCRRRVDALHQQLQKQEGGKQ